MDSTYLTIQSGFIYVNIPSIIDSVSGILSYPCEYVCNNQLCCCVCVQRGVSFQSEGATSRASSVESLLESRRVDAEAVLRGVGFGPSPARQQLARIPDRFLKPSQVTFLSNSAITASEQFEFHPTDLGKMFMLPPTSCMPKNPLWLFDICTHRVSANPLWICQ